MEHRIRLKIGSGADARDTARAVCDIVEEYLSSDVRSMEVSRETQMWLLQTLDFDVMYHRLQTVTMLNLSINQKRYWEYIETIRAVLAIRLIEGP